MGELRGTHMGTMWDPYGNYVGPMWELCGNHLVLNRILPQNHTWVPYNFPILPHGSQRMLRGNHMGPMRELRFFLCVGKIGQINVVGKSILNKFSNKLSKTRKRDEDLEKFVRQYFDINGIGLDIEKSQKSEDERALEILDSTSRYVNGAWEVGLLWKENYKTLPNSLPMALQRLFGLERRLDRDNVYAELYYQEMKRLIAAGFARKVKREKESGFGIYRILE
ncbi:hypothetical protein TSAR_011967 [Trichomalopsis sarcophagae]|uniref:Uncharacterized protein n=1 Tax=Trichomalopsis sarcophagae TaxID=543379 RepID=A0A232EF64_9HYME|nr:hypothetical protein TSAR_011967 [Trichomalopsis sarcophagae]